MCPLCKSEAKAKPTKSKAEKIWIEALGTVDRGIVVLARQSDIAT